MCLKFIVWSYDKVVLQSASVDPKSLQPTTIKLNKEGSSSFF